MNKKCAICEKERDLFELKFESDETDAGEEFSKYVCGSCWEVIAAIGRRVAKNILANSQAAQQSFAADGFTDAQRASIRMIARDVAFSESPV